MAIFNVDGKVLHPGRDVRERIDAYYEAIKKPVPESQAPVMILYGLSVIAEALSQPSGLFADSPVEIPLQSLPTTRESRGTLRGQIIEHLKHTGFARPALDIRHCAEHGPTLHGLLNTKLVPLSFLGPVTLVATSAGALRELRKPARDRLKVFRGADPTKAIGEWEQLHTRHLALHREHLAKRPNSGRTEVAAAHA